VFISEYKEGVSVFFFFMFISMILRVVEWMEERMKTFLSLLTQMKKFVLIHITFLYFNQISMWMHFITIYKIKDYKNLFNNFKSI